MEDQSHAKRKHEHECRDNETPPKRLKRSQKENSKTRTNGSLHEESENPPAHETKNDTQLTLSRATETSVEDSLSRKAKRRLREAASQEASDVPPSSTFDDAKQSSTTTKVHNSPVSTKTAQSSVGPPLLKSRWAFSPIIAGQYLDHDPVFVKNEKGKECLIVANVHEIKLLSLEDSLVVRAHAAREGHQISSFAVTGQHARIAYTNGLIEQWDYMSGLLENDCNAKRAGQTIDAIACVGKSSYYITSAEGTTSIVNDSKTLFKTTKSLFGLQVIGFPDYIVAWGPGILVIGLASPKRAGGPANLGFEWLEIPMQLPLVCATARLVKQYESDKKSKQQKQSLAIAVGTKDGSIQLYHDLSTLFKATTSPNPPTPQILHWHRPGCLSAVKFSRDGNYMITGGKETVLVIWQLSTGKRQYLPHLTSEIERIVVSPEGTRYALKMGDNSIMVLNTTELQAVAHFPGLQQSLYINSETDRDAVAGFRYAAALNPHRPSELLLTVPSTRPKRDEDVSTRPFLQTFDVRHSRHLSRQALTRNNVTDFNEGPEGNAIIPPDVPHLAISHDGQWLASIDQWTPPMPDFRHVVPDVYSNAMQIDDALKLKEQQERKREVYLKFWQRDEQTKLWTLNTRVSAPHARAADADLGSGAGRVLKLLNDPVTNGFVTLGEDSKVKIWRPRLQKRQGVPPRDASGKDQKEWICSKTIQLPVLTAAEGRADSPIGSPLTGSQEAVLHDACMAFSPDSSLLACGLIYPDEEAESRVHFISPETGTIVDSKSRMTVPDADLVDLAFVDRFFIAVSKRSVRVWNLVNDSYEWTITIANFQSNFQGPLVAADHADETFIVVSAERHPHGAIAYHARVYSPKSTSVLFSATLHAAPAAILASNSIGGYTFLFEDGTIQTLANSSSGRQRMSLADAESPDNDVPMTEIDVEADALGRDGHASTVSLLAGGSQDKDEDVKMSDVHDTAWMDEAEEDDRPVVRPEQLAEIFDVGQSYAMSPVRDMFQAVVGLYARKPRQAIAAG